MRDRKLLLDVVINGHGIGMIGEFHQHGTQLLARRRELKALGFLIDGAPRGAPDAELPLTDVPGVTFRIDERKQVLYVTAMSKALQPTELLPDLSAGASGAPQSGLGAVLNYNVAATTLFNAGSAPRTIGEALIDGRVFSPWGIIESTAIATIGAAGTEPLARLDTAYSNADPETLRRSQIGDIITAGLSWTNPIRLGGVQVSTDFAIRPDLVTFPTLSVAGQVAVPSSVDVLVNGAQVLSRDVPPGPFEIQQLPVVTGAGDVVVVTRSADGTETHQALPIYASSLLLAPGLQSYSAELGQVRLNYGQPNDGYHGGVGSISVRRGLLRWLTMEAHGEGALSAHLPDGLTTAAGGMGGGGATVAVGLLGTLEFDGAMSHFGGLTGRLASVAFERNGRFLSLSASLRTADHGFRDVSSAFGDAPPLLQMRGSLGLTLGSFGSVGLAYIGIRRDLIRAAPSEQLYGAPNPISAFGLNSLAVQGAATVSLLSVSYSRGLFGGATLYATAFEELARPSGTGATVGISVPFGRRGSLGASVETGSDGTAGTFSGGQSANNLGDFGWRALDDTGRLSRQMALGEYRSRAALLDGGVDRIGGQTTLRGSAQGALAFADGSLFAANTIYNSFAVVDTDRTAGVTVLQENRPLGRTDAAGQLLVTDLRSFEANRLAIDPADVPVDSQLGQTTKLVRPQDRSGVTVRFHVHSSGGAVVRLVDKAGVPVAVGGSARLVGAPQVPAAEVGYDGEAFMTGLQAYDTVVVDLPGGGRCRARFDYRPVTRSLPRIGPVRCLAIAA